MNSVPLVTVITPAYNRARFLPETVESVLAQGYPNLEYIVLDDGSTDDTRDVMKRYAGQVRYAWHANMGESRTVNKGWAMARGEYITVLNSDDIHLSGMLAASVAFMEERPELLVAYPDWALIDERSQVVQQVQVADYSYAEMVGNCVCLPGPGAMIRRRAFQLEPGRNPHYRLVADFEYWLRLGLHGPFARLPQCLATFRQHAGSATSRYRETMAREMLELMTHYFAQPQLPAEIRRLKRRSLSSTYFTVASMMKQDRLPYLRPLAYSLLYDPWRGSRSLARSCVGKMARMLRRAG
jgi:glycosyltransferase involved in cell wall biosynthesis